MKTKTDALLIVKGIWMLLILTACSSAKVQKPEENYTTAVIRPPASVITVSAEARLSDIQRQLNREFAGLVYEDNSFTDNGGDNLMIKAWKQGDIGLAMRDNVIIYRVPVKLWIKAGFKTTRLGITLSDYRELSGALVMTFRTSVTLKPDWTLETNTTSTGYEWLEEPVIKVAGFNVPVKFIADQVLKHNLNTIGKSIDKSVKQYLDLKPYMEQVWQEMNKPVMLSEQYKLWLVVEPSGLHASQIIAVNSVIKIQAGITSTIEAFAGRKPETRLAAPLPELQIVKKADNRAIVHTSVELPFEELNAVAASYLKGQSFSQGRKRVTIEGLNVYGSGRRLIAEAILSGSFKGKVYLSGIPAFNPSDSTLFLKDFDFDVSTRNVLHKSAAWLIQGGFPNLLKKHMVWPLSEDIRVLASTINTSFREYRLSEVITLNGEVIRMSVDDIVITPDGVKPFLSAEGTLGVSLSSFGIGR
ncbi:MAG TPA: DUF4403 family protein [Lentimicrobium sp.]|nr:DUF4403 family protein [Lentimicrobium sp.]